MKTHLRQLILTLLVASYGLNLKSQDLYLLDLSNLSNYYTTCGTVAPAKWSIKGVNAYCSLITSDVLMPGQPGDSALVAPVTIVIKNTGNIICNEITPPGVLIKYSVNNGGWFAESSIPGCSLQNQSYTYSFMLYAPAGAVVKLMVTVALGNLISNSATDKIWVENGGIKIGSAIVATESTWTKNKLNNVPDFTPTVENDAAFKVFPNPTERGNIKISFTSKDNDDEECSVLVVLYDMLGREAYSKVMISRSGKFIEAIDCGERLIPGVYFITASNKNEIYKETLVVK